MHRRVTLALIMLVFGGCNKGGTLGPTMPGMDIIPLADGVGDIGSPGDSAGDAATKDPDGVEPTDLSDSTVIQDLASDLMA